MANQIKVGIEAEQNAVSFEQTDGPIDDSEYSAQTSDENLMPENAVRSFEQTDNPIDDSKFSAQTSDELGSGTPENAVRSFEEADDPVDDSEFSAQTSDELGSWTYEGPDLPVNVSAMLGYPDYPILRGNSPDAVAYNHKGASVPDTLNILFNIIRISLPMNASVLVTFTCYPETSLASKKSNTPDAAVYNDKGALIPDTLNILDESVDFLKGPMVTRVMPSFYIIIILISLPLNALAVVTFTCRIREKKPAVIYMSHLACVDLLFNLLLPLKIHYQMNGSDWVFGEAACRVLSAAYYCYMYCSILLMMSMSVDRLLAVVFPIASLTWRTTRKATFICTLVWLLALVGTVPLLLMSQTVNIKNVGVTCHDVLRQNDPTVLYYVYLFSILSCLYFFLPLVVTLVSYFAIIYALSVKSNRLATSSSDKRRRPVIMAVAVLFVFVVCFAPNNGILLYHCVHLATGGHREGDSSYAAYLLAVCLGSASVFLDPLLYYYGSSQCRKQIRSVFWCKKAKKSAKTQSDTKTSPCTTAAQ
ncbi:proteinase-activated receptor 1-like [Garra rufa]|uniref:proteinase-activated receptor 1-like n=1 Tax=Garra rufa TaxID=137080 RepID=UPI003CCEF33B